MKWGVCLYFGNRTEWLAIFEETGIHLLSSPPIIRHLCFWLCAFAMLSYLYATAFDNLLLGVTVIIILLPVHIIYFYLLDQIVVRHFYSREEYGKAIAAGILLLLLAAFLYRVVEVFLSDPYIYKFYKKRDPGFSWARMNLSKSKQLFSPALFGTAIERSNAVVWIGITLKLFTLSHHRKQLAVEAELNLLKAQVHPHFLFNSLNNIYALSLNGSEKTPEVILGISNILRYSLYECTSDKVALKREIEILKDYIQLEHIRYEERLEVNLHLDEDKSGLTIAPMLMLPLVENAFKHGIAETVDSPWINIELYLDQHRLILKISNSKPELMQHADQSAGRIGIENIRKRLALLYAGRYQLDFHDEQDCFITILKLNLST